MRVLSCLIQSISAAQATPLAVSHGQATPLTGSHGESPPLTGSQEHKPRPSLLFRTQATIPHKHMFTKLLFLWFLIYL